VTLANDDFGTGYSSLSYLTRFPVDKLKIDQSFLRERGEPARDRLVVEAIIGLARNLGLACIAEGVESAEVAARLRALGCDYAQGYHFARPLPGPELQAFARRQSR
jgi:EAL domain-containing protein (putative c-di-GMP-specific phosphodiesterase class I)